MVAKRNIFSPSPDVLEENEVTFSRYREDNGSSARGTFIIEALLLLLFVVILIAASMTIFASALSMGSKSMVTDEAMALAEDIAEQFSVSPSIEAGQEEWIGDSYSITCNIDANPTNAGVVYEADIKVYCEGEEVYDLRTSRYMSSAPTAASSSSTSAAGVGR